MIYHRTSTGQDHDLPQNKHRSRETPRGSGPVMSLLQEPEEVDNRQNLQKRKKKRTVFSVGPHTGLVCFFA